MFFQFVQTKFFKSKLFSCLPKVDHVINSCKRPIFTAWTDEVHKNQSSLLSPSYALIQMFNPIQVSSLKNNITLEQCLAEDLRAEVIAYQGGYVFKTFFFFFLRKKKLVLFTADILSVCFNPYKCGSLDSPACNHTLD